MRAKVARGSADDCLHAPAPSRGPSTHFLRLRAIRGTHSPVPHPQALLPPRWDLSPPPRAMARHNRTDPAVSPWCLRAHGFGSALACRQRRMLPQAPHQMRVAEHLPAGCPPRENRSVSCPSRSITPLPGLLLFEHNDRNKAPMKGTLFFKRNREFGLGSFSLTKPQKATKAKRRQKQRQSRRDRNYRATTGWIRGRNGAIRNSLEVANPTTLVSVPTLARASTVFF